MRFRMPTNLPERLAIVLQGDLSGLQRGLFGLVRRTLTRPDLSAEAIRLGRLLADLLPEPETVGLLALMLLNELRRAARTLPDGELILLADQDRSLWAGTRSPRAGGW